MDIDRDTVLSWDTNFGPVFADGVQEPLLRGGVFLLPFLMRPDEGGTVSRVLTVHLDEGAATALRDHLDKLLRELTVPPLPPLPPVILQPGVLL